MGGAIGTRVAAALGREVGGSKPLGGGCIGEVYLVDLAADNERVVAKLDRGRSPKLDIEGYMLTYLGEHSDLPTPAVLHSEPDLLVMTYAEGDSRFSNGAEIHAADLLSALHAVTAPRFGLERDTLIGGLHQPNPRVDRWVALYGEHRLMHMTEHAAQEGRVDNRFVRRMESFVARLDEFIDEPNAPALLHGDVWTTNVLAHGDRITAFLDPAIYYGHPEVELAFITLFSTFGDAFFRRYEERRGIAPGFFETRRDIYVMYPLLVHVRLFGGGYLNGVERTLDRLGF